MSPACAAATFVKGADNRSGCVACSRWPATARLCASVVDELQHALRSQRRIGFCQRIGTRRRQHEPELFAANVRADRRIPLAVDRIAEAVGEHFADRGVIGGAADVDQRRGRRTVARGCERSMELAAARDAPCRVVERSVIGDGCDNRRVARAARAANVVDDLRKLGARHRRQQQRDRFNHDASVRHRLLSCNNRAPSSRMP